MSIEIRESLPLGRFIYDYDWTPLKGTYIYPLRFFGSDRSYDPNDYLEVVRVVDIDGTDVAITRGGGLFVRDNEQFQTRETTGSLVSLLNLLLCEFAFQGLVSQPITDTDVQSAKLIGRHASITGGWGSYAERTWGPYTLLGSGARDMAIGYTVPRNDYWPVNFYWTTHNPEILDKITGLSDARTLKQLSPTLPLLLVAAAYHSSRHNLAETSLTAWITSEEILSYLWDQYVSSMPEKGRRSRLNDVRTYSASV